MNSAKVCSYCRINNSIFTNSTNFYCFSCLHKYKIFDIEKMQSPMNEYDEIDPCIAPCNMCKKISEEPFIKTIEKMKEDLEPFLRNAKKYTKMYERLCNERKNI